MRKLTYSMGVSLDGYISDGDGDIGWSAPDDELHRFHNQQTAETGVQLLGRRLYEEMLPWETMHENPDATEAELEFAGIWQALPKVVFSSTLDHVEGNARLVRGGVAEEVTRLKEEAGGPVAVGGAGLAAACAQADLIDEYRLFVSPVVLGAGTPYFPELEKRMALELMETRTFGSRVVYLRYVRR